MQQAEIPKIDPKPVFGNDPNSSRNLSKYVTFYVQNIRDVPKVETVGVIRSIQRLLEKGAVTHEEIAVALRNYRDDPFRREADPRMVKHIRSFFTADTIKQWQRPVERTARGFRAPSPMVQEIERAEAVLRPVADIQDPIRPAEEEEQEFTL
jgi:hypothetical protein